MIVIVHVYCGYYEFWVVSQAMLTAVFEAKICLEINWIAGVP
jgi:hypothetical protein